MDENFENIYNRFLSQIIQFMTQLQDGDSTLCCNHVLESTNEHTTIMTWADYEKTYRLIGKILEDLKTVMLTRIARDTNYSLEKIITETKKFMSHDDYISTIEKLISLRFGGSDAYYDICNCDSCN